MSANRSQDNGAYTFPPTVTNDLADYVKSRITEKTPENVLKLVDEFCWNRQWMMHVGDKKGKIVNDALTKHKPKTILELGTYCAYSTIILAKDLPNDGKVYTIDPYPTNCSKVLVDCAGLNDKIVFLEGFADQVIPQLKLQGQVDMVFIDHAKNKYCSDLKLIEQYNLMHSGSVVVADNVIVFKINDYISHVRTSGKYSSSVNYLSTLEYEDSNTEDMVDGIEVSVYS